MSNPGVVIAIVIALKLDVALTLYALWRWQRAKDALRAQRDPCVEGHEWQIVDTFLTTLWANGRAEGTLPTARVTNVAYVCLRCSDVKVKEVNGHWQPEVFQRVLVKQIGWSAGKDAKP